MGAEIWPVTTTANDLFVWTTIPNELTRVRAASGIRERYKH